MTEMLAAPA